MVIDSSLLALNLFVRPDYCHYYFGDYYADNDAKLGIYPWFAVREHPNYVYDPLFSFYGWRNRARDPNWEKNLRNWNAYYHAHPDQRIPRNLASLQRVNKEAGNRPDRRFLNIADTLENWRGKTETHMPLVSVSAEQKNRFHESSRLMRQFGTERGQMETQGTAGKVEGNTTQLPNEAMKMKMPETLQLPKVARKLTEGMNTRMDGSVPRSTAKPVIPPQMPERKGELKDMPKNVEPKDMPKNLEPEDIPKNVKPKDIPKDIKPKDMPRQNAPKDMPKKVV